MTTPTRSPRSPWLKAVSFVLFLPLTLLAIILAAPFTILGRTAFRGRCHYCHRRGLGGTRVHGDDGPYFWSECAYCHHQFHTFDDHSFIHIAPDDVRYIRIP